MLFILHKILQWKKYYKFKEMYSFKEKISQNIFRNNGELISCYDLDTCFGGIDFQAYRTKMKAGFTKGVRSCTCGLIVAKDKKTSSFFPPPAHPENCGLPPPSR